MRTYIIRHAVKNCSNCTFKKIAGNDVTIITQLKKPSITRFTVQGLLNILYFIIIDLWLLLLLLLLLILYIKSRISTIIFITVVIIMLFENQDFFSLGFNKFKH